MRAFTVGAVLVSMVAFAADVELTAGEQQVIDVPDVQKIAIGDSAIADVKTIGNGQVLVIGASAGKTSLSVWKKSGERVSYLITVKRGEPELARSEGEIVLQRGELTSFKATGITQIKIADPRVVEAKLNGGRLELRGKAAGRSDLIAVGKPETLHLAVIVADDPQAGFQLTAVELKVGASVKLAIENATEAKSIDLRVAAANVPQPGALVINARAAGEASIELMVNGRSQKLLVRIVP